MANAKRTQRLDMNSLKYVVEFDNPGARGGVARTVGLYKFGCFWVDDGDDRFPPAAEGFDLHCGPRNRPLGGLRPRWRGAGSRALRARQ